MYLMYLILSEWAMHHSQAIPQLWESPISSGSRSFTPYALLVSTLEMRVCCASNVRLTDLSSSAVTKASTVVPCSSSAQRPEIAGFKVLLATPGLRPR